MTRNDPEKPKNVENYFSYPSRRVQKPVPEENTEADSRPSITYLFWHAKHFEHFHYLYKLARDCENRVEKLKQSKNLANRMPEDVVIKIGIVGNFTKDSVKLISKRSGSYLSLNAFVMK